jgi:hypothetical protein
MPLWFRQQSECTYESYCESASTGMAQSDENLTLTQFESVKRKTVRDTGWWLSSAGNHRNVTAYHSLDVHQTFFTFIWPCIVTNFLIIKPTRCTNFSNLFSNKTLHVSDSSSVNRQELFTVHSAMVYVIRVYRQLSSMIRVKHPDHAARKLSTNPYDIYNCWVYSE